MKNVITAIATSLTAGILIALFISIFLPALGAQARPMVDTNTRNNTALTQLYPGLDDELLDQLAVGRSFFTIPWVAAPAATQARDGLGPLFNANTCVSCHQNLGGGEAISRNGPVDRSIVFVVNHDGSPENESPYGDQIAINAIHGVPFEARIMARIGSKTFTYNDGETVELFRPAFDFDRLNYGDLYASVNARRTPALIGLGLIEKIPTETILAFEDEEDHDNDGISGKANFVWSYQHDRTMLGKLGWKASSVSTIEQSAKAAINDMGLTSKWFPEESCTNIQTECKRAYRSKQHDLPFKRLVAISEYLKHLRIPKPGNLEPVASSLFRKTGCQNCHRSDYQLSDGRHIQPYSDFLLHDMGDALADSGLHQLAREWRTPPLWGIGVAKTINPDAGFLHDGRASTLEQAILWHGGEAEESKKRFTQLSKSERRLLIKFLENI